MHILDLFEGAGSPSSLTPASSFDDIARGLLELSPEMFDSGHFIEDEQSLPDSSFDFDLDIEDTTSGDLEDFSELLSFEPEKFSGLFCENEIQVSDSLFEDLQNLSPEVLPTGHYEDVPGTPNRELLGLGNMSKARLSPPDISAGLGNREESKNIAALEKYVVSAEHWLNDHGTLCLYSTPYWRRLEGEDNAVREIRTILSPHADISNSLTAYD